MIHLADNRSRRDRNAGPTLSERLSSHPLRAVSRSGCRPSFENVSGLSRRRAAVLSFRLLRISVDVPAAKHNANSTPAREPTNHARAEWWSRTIRRDEALAQLPAPATAVRSSVRESRPRLSRRNVLKETSLAVARREILRNRACARARLLAPQRPNPARSTRSCARQAAGHPRRNRYQAVDFPGDSAQSPP